MSLSDTDETGLLTGRVILGAGQGGEAETTIMELESRRSPVHYEEVENQFWERVRAKAQAKASAIMAQAMAEAERIKAAAHEEGYNAGVAAAADQIQTELAQMATTLGSVLESVAGERKKLYASYRRDFVTLLHLAVERTIGAVIDTKRREILDTLLGEALDLLDARDALTLTVHPDDEGIVRELMARAAGERTGIDRFQVRLDANLIPGSVTLESSEGLVDNSLASRFADVETIFNNLAAGGGDAP
jgi:flagellar assembly protein FliH